MKHPVEFQRYLQYAQILRGGLDVTRPELFEPDGRRKKMEVGRGGKRGASSCRGTRGGRKHRAFKLNRHFMHGGNVPYYRTVRKHRLANPNLLIALPSEINLDNIQKWIEQGSLDPDKPIDMSLLTRAGLIESCEDGLKIVYKKCSTFSSKINIVVSEADVEAIKVIEKFGGTIQCRYYTVDERKHMSTPEKYFRGRTPTPGLPPHRSQIEYYADPMNRGYLAPTSGDKGQFALLKMFKDAYVLNKDKVDLPPNLSQGLIRERGELRHDLDPRTALRDYASRWNKKREENHFNHVGTDQFARKLLRANAVKPDSDKQRSPAKETAV